MLDKRRTLQLLLALLLGSSWVFAQGQGALVGTVRDPSGAVIAGAQVVATHVETGIPSQITTNESGDYNFSALPVGTYTVSFTAKGFEELKVEKIEIHVSETIRKDAALKVQTAATRLEVTAATPMVKSESAEIGSLVGGQEVTELPVQDRDVFDLVKLSAGAETAIGGQVPGALNPESMPTLAGGRAGQALFQTDGSNITSENLPGPGVVPIADAVEEMRVITQLAPASEASSAFITVATKSGSNNFHGTAYDFLQNNVLNAQPFFETLIKTPAFTSALPTLRYNQFGGTIGGPIVKNRTFFFGGVEILRDKSSGQGESLMPSTAEVNGDFSGINPVTQQPFGPVYDPQTGLQFPGNVISTPENARAKAMAQAFFAAPNCQACLAEGLGFNYIGANVGFSKYERYLARIDHRISTADNVFFSFQFSPSDAGSGYSAIPAMPTHGPTGSGLYSLSWSHIFRPNLLNQARISFMRTDTVTEQQNSANGQFTFTNTPFSDSTLYPMDIISGYPNNGCCGVYGNQLFSQAIHTVDEHGSANDDLTWMHGTHQFKLGGEVLRDHFYVRNTLNAVFIYGDNLPAAWGFTGNAMGDFFLGVPLEGITYQGSGRASLVERWRDNVYFQDDWKASSNLTLNLGLRWDWFQRWHDSNTTLNRLGTVDLSPASYAMGGRYLMAGSPNYYLTGVGVVQGTGAPLIRSQIVDPELTDFQPRIGLAYRPFKDNKTAIRAGFGIYYYAQWANALSFTETDPPFEFEVSQVNEPPAVPLGHPYTLDTFWPNLATTGVGGTGLDPRNRDPRMYQWTLSVQHQVSNSTLFSLEYLGNHSQHNMFSMWPNEPPLPNSSQLAQLEANPNLSYPLALARVPLPNIALQYEYDDNDADSWYEALNVKAEGRYRQGFHWSSLYTWSKALDLASEDNIEPTTVYNLRLNKGYAEFDHPQRFVSTAVYNLPFGETYLVPTNSALKKLVSGWEVTGISTFESGAPFNIAMGVDTSFRGGLNVNPAMTGPPVFSNIRKTNGIYLTPQNFTAPPFGTLSGEIARNSIHGPGVNNFDLGFIKNTVVREKLRLQFRAEMFNAFNHAQFNIGAQSVAYGIAPPAAGQTLPQVLYNPASQFGRVSARAPRVIQFALKLLF